MTEPKFNYMVLIGTDPVPTYKSAWAEGCPIPCTYLNGRPVYYGDAVHGDDACDSYFESASFADTDIDLDEDELDQLTTESSEYLAEQWFEHQIDRAEYLYDMAMDR